MYLNWMLTFLLGLITYMIYKKYLKIRRLPPGPFPLPFVGSLLSFRKKKASDVLEEYRKKYGNIFTVWLGQFPFVFVCDLPQIKESLIEHRNDFAGRPYFRSFEIFLDGHTNISDSDFGKPYESLRKIGHAAIRKYAASEELPLLIDNATQETVRYLTSEKESFDPKDHIYLLISNITASSIIGKRFSTSDPEFIAFREIAETISSQFGKGFMLDFMPFLSCFYRKETQKLKKASQDVISVLLEKLQQHMLTKEKGVVRDVIDSILSAREECFEDGKETAVYLTDINLAYCLFDLYFASIETTHIAIRWILLLLANHQDIQKMMMEELLEKIGDRIPMQEDRRKCPFTTAVIYEALRIRTSAPFSLPLTHKAICDSQIDGNPIPKGTHVIVCVDMVHKNPTYWDEPEKFKPQRFLNENGNFTERKTNQYMPFGKGSRSCIGDKLAIVEMFLVLAGIFRKCRIFMKVPPEDLIPQDVLLFVTPKQYKITAEYIH